VSPQPPSGPSEFAEHLVEFTEAASAREAEELAARLRRHGIVALANAEPLPRRRSWRGVAMPEEFRPFVVVLRADVDKAHAFLDAETVAEGQTPRAEIERELREAEEDESDDGANIGPTNLERFFDRVTKMAGRVVLTAAVLLVLAIVTSIIVKAVR